MYEQNKDYSIELEQAIIGACLLEKSAIARVYNPIKPEHFYGAETKNAAKAIWTMFDKGLPIDLVTAALFLINNMGLFHLNGNKQLHETDYCDLPYSLTKLTNAVTTTANLEYYAKVLKALHLKRKVKEIKASGNQTGNPYTDIQNLQKELNDLTESNNTTGWQDMTELMVSLYKHQDEMQLSGGKGLQTKFSLLDELNGGFFPGQMVIIGARPSIGKSAFAGQIARNVAAQGYKVGIISLEMNNNEISARLAAIDTSIDFSSIYRNLFRDEIQREYFYEKVNSDTSKLPIFITDKTGVNINDIRAEASALKSRSGLDILVIDYLQLISTEGNRNKNRENEISDISRGCKIMAKEMQIPVFVLCQLNREMTKRKGSDRYPHLSDLRESGSLEQDADVVMFLHRDWPMGYLTDEQNNSTEFDADLIIRKWRNGKLAHIRMEFSGPKMMFHEKLRTGFVPIQENPF